MYIYNKTRNISSIFLQLFRRSHQSSQLCKNKKNMESAYYRYTCGAENFEFSFVYGDKTNNFSRQFNFTRQSNEDVGTLLKRISANVEKHLTKKKKKTKNKSEENCSQHDSVVAKLLKNGEIIPDNQICTDVIQIDSRIELYIADNKLNVRINAPHVIIMILPTSILAGFPLYPLKFRGVFVEKNNCIFKWYSGKLTSSTTKIEWSQVGEGFVFNPQTSDIGKRIKLVCVPGNGDVFGAETETISTVNVEAGPGFCPFENRHLFTSQKLSFNEFRIGTYNILADLYCDSEFSRTELFPYCPPYALNIDYRKLLLVKEILGYNCDILCLQEVDFKVFEGDLLPVMSANCSGIFTKKGKEVAEGLACFYRNDRFRLIDQMSCTLGEELSTSPVFEKIWLSIQNNEPFVNRISPRTTVVQATVLESIDNCNEVIVVGNTHLYFKPDADHIRVMQGGLTILWLNDIIEKVKKKVPEKRVSLILCGDFNSVPSCGVYQLFTTGHVPNDHIDWKSNEVEAVKNVDLTQPIPLISACGTPEFTNYTVGFADCLDYIFCEKSNFEVTQIVPLPTVEELSQHVAIPSVVFPSDHVSLIADLKLIK